MCFCFPHLKLITCLFVCLRGYLIGRDIISSYIVSTEKYATQLWKRIKMLLSVIRHALYSKLITFKEADLNFTARDTARQTSAISLLEEQMNRAFPWLSSSNVRKTTFKASWLPCFPFLAPSALRICFCFSINFSVPEARKGWGLLFHVFRLPCFFQVVLKVNKIDKTRLMSWGLDVFILYFESVTSKP